MASRLRLPIDTREIADASDRLKRWRAHLQRLGVRLLLWRILWSPFWFGGELPAPWLPDRADGSPPPDAPAARQLTRALDAISRRIWWNTLLAAIARGLWLPFALGSIVTIVQIMRGRDWNPERFIWIWSVTVPLAVLLAWLMKPDRMRVATMLDQTFNLRDRMTTAMELLHRPAPANGERAPLPYLQTADAANVAIGLRADPRFRLHLPSREISLAIMTGLLLMALLFLRGVGGELPTLSESQVPPFVPAAERRTAAAEESNADPNQRPPTVQEVQASAERSQDAEAALNALADALDDNALTQPAADAIRAGDYETAAQILRDIAAQAGSLPPESREELAGALDLAAQAMEETSPALSNAASQASEGLQQGGESAQSGMQDLGDAVELAGESVVPQEVLADQMQQAEQAAASQPNGADAAQAPNQSSGQQSGASQSDPDPSNQSSGEPGEPGSASNTGGADARPGEANQSDEMSQSGDQESSSDATSGGSQSQPESQAASGSQSQSGEATDGSGQQPASESDSGGESQGQSQSGATDPESQSATTSGGDQSMGETSQSQGSGASGSSQQTPSAGEQNSEGAGAVSEQTPGAVPTGTSVAAAPTPSSAGAAPTTAPSSAVELDDQGGGESIQLGGGGSASSLGSGAGVMVAGGDATQEPVATAGPQSNRVPDDYKTIVENYFSRDGS